MVFIPPGGFTSPPLWFLWIWLCAGSAAMCVMVWCAWKVNGWMWAVIVGLLALGFTVPLWTVLIIETLQ
jgi:hypothetical protein